MIVLKEFKTKLPKSYFGMRIFLFYGGLFFAILIIIAFIISFNPAALIGIIPAILYILVSYSGYYESKFLLLKKIIICADKIKCIAKKEEYIIEITDFTYLENKISKTRTMLYITGKNYLNSKLLSILAIVQNKMSHNYLYNSLKIVLTNEEMQIIKELI